MSILTNIQQRFAALKQFLLTEKVKLVKSATLWVSYFMMAWPTLVTSIHQEQLQKAAGLLPPAWHDKSIAVLGVIVWLARMRTLVPKAPPT